MQHSMDLLPTTHKDFAKEKYWDDFFVKLHANPFEWYGEYESLSGILSKYIRVKDRILMLGCGNSTLSADLYNAGFCSIVNIDISSAVVKQMKEKYEDKCPNMVFEKMDLFDMKFENEDFTVAVDKGTLDSIMIDGSEKISESISHAFSEISRILKFGGRYICISLLQEHILRKILSWFSSEGWMIRIHRCFEAERKYAAQSVNFPVFIVVCTKLKKIPGSSPILELLIDEENTPKRMCDVDDVIECISSVQRLAFLKHQLSKKKVSEEHVLLELCCSKSGKVKYKLFVVDSVRTARIQFAVFIVPQGRETEWLFATDEGRKELALNADCERLIVVHLMRDFSYRNLDEVKEDLSVNVMELAPGKLKSKVPFLSLGDDVGWREIQTRGSNKVSGEYVIEDILGEDNIRYRRLIFLANPYTIQSEAKLEKDPQSTKDDYKVDFDYLACNHHSAMISGLALLESNVTSPKILLIGLGGGGLAMYMHRHLPEAKISVVELDPDIVSIAENWFDFETSQNLDVTVSDGVSFMKEASEKGTRYDVVMLDVDNKDQTLGMSCPPTAFVEQNTLEVMSQLIGQSGIAIINLACRNPELHRDVASRLKSSFKSALHKKIPNEVNDVFYCMNLPSQFVSERVKRQAKDLQNLLWGQNVSDDSFDVSEIISCLETVT